jgi:adenylate cyclase
VSKCPYGKATWSQFQSRFSTKETVSAKFDQMAELRNGSRRSRALALPDKPSIAVLPFQNMSGDSEQEYFTDGIVEEIITALLRMRWYS